MTKTLRVDLADLEGIPHASGPSGTSVVVTAEYTSPVILESDGKIILSPKSKTMGASGRVDFDGIYASDSVEVRADHHGFAVRVKVDIREPNGATRTWSRTVKVLDAMSSPISLGALPAAEGLPAQWVSVDDVIGAADAAADAASQAATDASTALAQVGTAVAAAQAAQTAATTSASDASNAVTLAQQAQAAALEVPDANTAALIGNPATDTRAALATVLPDKRVEVASMPAWTGNPADDQSAAFAQAAAVHAGPMTIGVPVGTWKAQGLILREGLYYVGQGIEATTLTLPDSPTGPLMQATAGVDMWSGGVLSMSLQGPGGAHGDGHVPGAHGIDLSHYRKVYAFDVRDCFIQGFDRGVNGSQEGGTGLGDDRWLVISNVRVWNCHVGIYGNEHPMLFGVEVRFCYYGITGRLYDMTIMGGVKVNRCYVGIGGMADARCTNINAHIQGISVYRCEQGVVLGDYSSVRACRFTGGHPMAGERPPGSTTRDVVVEGVNVDVSACRFGTAADHSDVGVDIIAPGPTNHRDTSIQGCFFLAGGGQGNEHVAAIRAQGGGRSISVRNNYFHLWNDGVGIHAGAAVGVWNIESNHVKFRDDGQFINATGNMVSCNVENNRVALGAAYPLSRPVIRSGPGSTAWVTRFRNNSIARLVGGAVGVLIEADARSTHLEGNTADTACTVVSWTNTNGAADVVYMNNNRGPGAEVRDRVIATTTIPSGQSSVVVTHGLVKMPLSVIASPLGNGRVWVTDRNATTFTLNREGTSGGLVVAYQAYAFNQ